ncbi:Hypothetical protein LUCI_1216 [Lucifera butyrica]|uniref:Uncharacterized protein n=1 Tax=Lucifera butyrica TaxID=1351585 RepID=A0A498R4F0_9FIRM|nr:hypothetical protein [Lucifera butyrica]VBB06005.1 Hypothetical protein LUCI_1216 [Lucifera butyrica]
MPKYMQDDDQISDGVNLLISILVRYPEIGTVSFDPDNNSIKLTFMLSGISWNAEIKTAKQCIIDSIAAYHMLQNIHPDITDVILTDAYEQIAMLTIKRDVHTLSKGEIALIIALLRDGFRERLMSDQNDTMQEEDLMLQEELIDDMLENLKKKRTGHGLIGIREDGRVLVFNK